MRKLFALYTNEMIKISKKVSVIIILAIMVAIIFGFGGLMKYQDYINSKNESGYSYNIEFQKEEMNRQLENAKASIAELEKQKASASGAGLQNLEAELRSNQNTVDMIEYAQKQDILIYSSSYRAEAVQRLFGYKATEAQMNSIPAEGLSEEQKEQLSNLKKDIPALEAIIENKDFKGYIELLNEGIKNNTNTTDEEKQIYLESNNMKLKYDITGESEDNSFNSGNANYYINQWQDAKRSLLYDLNYTGNNQGPKPLTPEQREKIEKDIKVLEYKFEKGIISNTTTNNVGMDVKGIVIPGMLQIGLFMAAVLAMILAGGSISSEISTGSIKSLIISPTKRWKIYTAKFLSLLTIGIITALLAYVFSVLANGIYFGFDSGSPYIYASNGEAHELNFYVYQFARLFTDFIAVLVFMVFAFMLSIVTRNTAASVAISIAVYFVGSNANAILMQFVKGDWRRFIPFNNLDFANKIFTNDTLMQSLSNNGNYPVNNSLTFSLVYVAVLLFCMAYTALDSFNRRDIK